MTAGEPFVRPGKDEGAGDAGLECGVHLPRQDAPLFLLSLAERIDTEFGQHQRLVEGDIVQPRDVSAEGGLVVQIDVEADEISEVDGQVFGRWIISVADKRLRMLGFGLTNQSLAALATAVHPWLEASLALLVSTGLLLFASEAARVLHTPAFWVKIATLPVAVLYTFTVRRRVAAQSGPDTSRRTRVTATVSLLLWFTVAAAGRWIGFSS